MKLDTLSADSDFMLGQTSTTYPSLPTYNWTNFTTDTTPLPAASGGTSWLDKLFTSGEKILSGVSDLATKGQAAAQQQQLAQMQYNLELEKAKAQGDIVKYQLMLASKPYTGAYNAANPFGQSGAYYPTSTGNSMSSVVIPLALAGILAVVITGMVARRR